MIWLALRLSLHNRTRLAVTLVGVIFSSYLTLTEVALYIGMMENATAVIRHAGADLGSPPRVYETSISPTRFPKIA